MQTRATRNFDIVAQGYEFIEAPRVSPQGDLWFADLTGGGVYRQRQGHPVEAMLPGRQWVGGLVFDESGAVICGGRGGIVAFDPATGAARDLLSHIDGAPIVAVNDMEGDGRGGFFAGTIDFAAIFERGEAPAAGTFFHMSAQGEVTVLRRDVFASNGIATSPCGRWLYHSETSRGVWRYPLDAGGLPGPGELVIPLEDSDGLALDTSGNLWIACWSTGTLKQFSPAGLCLQSLSFGYPHIVSVAFASTDPDYLYITTGGNVDRPGAGDVLRMRVDVPGLPGPRTRLKVLEKSA